MVASDEGTMQFIIDEPAKVDFFETHGPIAKAIVKSIISNPRLKIIGLLGRWGSGKSTIVREIADELTERSDGFRLFTYDAWLHQHDPMRRSFLESLAEFLWNRALVDKNVWSKKIDRLSGAVRFSNSVETPEVTYQAKELFVLSLIIGVGLWLMTAAYKGALGTTFDLLSLSLFRVSLVLTIVPILYWCGRYFYLLWSGQRIPFIPNLLLKRDISQTNTITTQDIDATSIEFGRKFRLMMKEAHANGAKVVIVVDNIDRLQTEEALNLWAGIRSFFLAESSDDQIESQEYHPAVILPVDHDSIAQMFAIKDSPTAADTLATSFINKTFDVTFVVPAPVMSDWKRYLKEKMQAGFGVDFNEERYFWTKQFLEKWIDTNNVRVTPRDINKVINSIIALRLQWPEQAMPFAIVAYYSINRKELDRDIALSLRSDDSPLLEISTQWREQLAALHYGVAVEHAAQVLMADPIRVAFLTGKTTDLQQFETMDAFGDQLEAVSRDLPQRDGLSQLSVIANGAALLKSYPLLDPTFAKAAWRNLIKAFCADRKSTLISDIDGRLGPLLEHADEPVVLSLLEAVERLIDRALSSEEVTVAALRSAGSLAQRLIQFAHTHKLREPVFDLAGPAERYIRRLAGLSPFPSVQARVRSDVTQPHIVSELARLLADPQRAEAAPQLIALLTSEAAVRIIGKPLAESQALISEAENIARANQPNHSLFSPSVRVLVAINEHRDAGLAALGRLADDGSLNNGLASLATEGDSEALAVAVAALIWRGRGIASPTGSRWRDAFSAFEGLPTKINKYLDLMIGKDESQISLIRSLYNNHRNSEELASGLLEDRVKRRSLGAIFSQNVFDNLYSYRRIIDPRLRAPFEELLVSNYNNFTRSIANVAWSPRVYEACARLIKKDKDGSFRSQLLERIKSTDAETWTDAIFENSEPIRTVTTLLSPSEFSNAESSSLFSALTSATTDPRLVSDPDAQARWFALSKLLHRRAQRAAYNLLASNMFKWNPTAKLRALRLGGSHFVKNSGIFQFPDETLEAIVATLARSKAGRAWLKSNKALVDKAVLAASDVSRTRFRNFVERSLVSHDPDRRAWAAKIQKNLVS